MTATTPDSYEHTRMLRSLPSYMTIGLPPDEVLRNALCHLDISPLFAPRTAEEIEEHGRNHTEGRIRQAVSICNGDTGEYPCPVRAECFKWAVENGEQGVWGGMLITGPVLKKAGFRARKAGRPGG